MTHTGHIKALLLLLPEGNAVFQQCDDTTKGMCDMVRDNSIAFMCMGVGIAALYNKKETMLS